MGIIQWVKKHSPTILTVLAAIGTVATAVLAAKDTPQALMAMYRAEGEAEGELTVPEKARALAPHYIPAVMTGVATLACIFGANAINQKTIASMVGAYAMLDSAYNEYRKQVADIVGPGATRIADKAMAELTDHPDRPLDEVQTFYEENYGKFFECTMKTVMQAEYHINRNLNLKGSVTLNEFYDFLGLKHTKNGDQLGWNQYDGEVYWGYQWIDFAHRYFKTDDGLTVCSIDMPFLPHAEGEEGPPDDPPERN